MSLTADLPVVLPRLVVHANGTGSYTLTPDDDTSAGATTVAGETVSTARLGSAIARYVEQAATPVRVEVHEVDGTVHADIIQPPAAQRQSAVARVGDGAAKGVGDDAAAAARGFLPGERVWVALVVHAARADTHGQLRLPLTPPAGATPQDVEAWRGYKVVLVGATSHTAAIRPHDNGQQEHTSASIGSGRSRTTA